MKGSRIKRRERNSNKVMRIHLLFFVVLPLLALVIGYGIARFIIIPKFLWFQ